MIKDGLHDVPAGKVAMIVTHLQMLSKPTTVDADAPAGINFRRVKPDLAWYRDIFDRVGRPWLWYGRRLLPDDALMDILNDPHIELYTLEAKGQSEALLELDFRVQGECELAYFGLTQNLIGTGAGRYLMGQAIQRAWSQAITRFHVHTCTIDSPQALPFYVRSGFTPYKQQVEIDDDPRLKGHLPREAGAHLPIFEEP